MKHEFLKYLEENFYVEFDQDDKYVLDENGNVIELYLWGHNQTYGVAHDLKYISDISVLLPLSPYLRVLHINNWTVEDMSPIKDFFHLKELSLSGNNNIKKISGIEDLTELEYLNLSYNRIERIVGLERLTKLKLLDLQANGLGSKGYIKIIEGLDTLLNLESLYLHDNKIESIENINHLTNLRRLTLHRNELRTFENIDALSKLTRLTIESELTVFPDLRNHLLLEELGIKGSFNQIGNLDYLEHLHDINIQSEEKIKDSEILFKNKSLVNIQVNFRNLRGHVSQSFWTSDR